MPAQFLGSQYSSGSNQCVITLTDDVPADGMLAIFYVYDEGFNGYTPDSGTTDTGAHAWTVTTGGASGKCLIGLISQLNVPTNMIEAGSAGRVCTAGDLSAGDTVTLHFNGANVETLAVLAYIPVDFSVPAVYQADAGLAPTTPTYSNGNKYPSLSPSASDIRWATTGLISATGDDPCYLIAVMGAKAGQTGFTWTECTSLHEETAGGLSIHVGVRPGMAAAEAVDPGGQWPTGRTITAGNYQLGVEIVAPAEAKFNHTFYAEDDLGLDRTEQYPIFNHTFKAEQ